MIHEIRDLVREPVFDPSGASISTSAATSPCALHVQYLVTSLQYCLCVKNDYQKKEETLLKGEKLVNLWCEVMLWQPTILPDCDSSKSQKAFVNISEFSTWGFLDVKVKIVSGSVKGLLLA